MMTVPHDATSDQESGTEAASLSLPATMMAVTAHRYGGSDVLTIESVPTPEPEPGRLLVRVMASSVNAFDWHMLSGTPYFLRLFAGLLTPKRLIQGQDVAGIVEAIGTDAVGFQVGDALFGAGRGSFADYTTVNPALVAALPRGVPFEAAAATSMAGITALQALKTHGALKPGDRVLINGAAGGVGTFAVQLAKALGAGHVTAVCSTRNVKQARARGADHVVDYLREDLVASSDEYDLVIDIVGNRSFTEIRSLLAPGARYVGVSGPMTNRWLGPLIYGFRMKLALRRTGATYHGFTADTNADDLTFLADLLVSGQLVPAIDRVVGLNGVAEAIDQMATGHGAGKIVIVPGGEGDGATRHEVR
jgi:NADPH:quinone reductase-like Zn-dependent oxidoreductase